MRSGAACDRAYSPFEVSVGQISRGWDDPSPFTRCRHAPHGRELIAYDHINEHDGSQASELLDAGKHASRVEVRD